VEQRPVTRRVSISIRAALVAGRWAERPKYTLGYASVRYAHSGALPYPPRRGGVVYRPNVTGQYSLTIENR
jgi:hypothetical protein